MFYASQAALWSVQAGQANAFPLGIYGFSIYECRAALDCYPYPKIGLAVLKEVGRKSLNGPGQVLTAEPSLVIRHSLRETAENGMGMRRYFPSLSFRDS